MGPNHNKSINEISKYTEPNHNKSINVKQITNTRNQIIINLLT